MLYKSPMMIINMSNEPVKERKTIAMKQISFVQRQQVLKPRDQISFE